ncbi:MAG TPA: efflux RND transporter periplasmic adaptor subunit [Cyclobacteriaceae bacterium]|nr:efflux RND transporter periplasmic adaptor subunit [Cyclobacteriaceae bacterium]
MKNYWKTNSLITLLFLAWSLNGCNRSDRETAAADQYTCPMHPQVVQDKPGTCPICAMELVKRVTNIDDVALGDEVKHLTKPPNESVVTNIQTVRAEHKTLPTVISGSGIINYDTRRTFSVPVRFGGRIEKLYLKYNYQFVAQGQPIMEIYSPELLTAQRELLFAIQHMDSVGVMGAKEKLTLLGLNDLQVAKIIDNRKETYAFPVYSQHSGYIVESASGGAILWSKTSAVPSMGSGGGMQGASSGIETAGPVMGKGSSTKTNDPFKVREGMYVNTGESLFNIIDDTRLWAELYFPAYQKALINKGDVVELTIAGSHKPVDMHVDFIQPFFSSGSEFLLVRSYLVNQGDNLRVGQLVKGKLTKNAEALFVPRSAVLDLGVQRVVFIKNNGTFTMRMVKTGLESGNHLEILDGLQQDSEIAINAQYLVDSESFIKIIKP